MMTIARKWELWLETISSKHDNVSSAAVMDEVDSQLQVFTELVQLETLCQLWVQLLVGSSKPTTLRLARAILSGYRMIANYFHCHPRWQTPKAAFEDLMTSSLATAIGRSRAIINVAMVSEVISLLSVDQLTCFLQCIERRTDVQDFIDFFPPQTCLTAAARMVTKPSRYCTHVKLENTSASPLDQLSTCHSFEKLLEAFVMKSLQDRSPERVIEQLILKPSSSSSLCARIVVSVIVAQQHLLELVDRVAARWSDRAFVMRNETPRMRYLTWCLLTAMGYLNKDSMMSCGPRGIPFCVVVSSGVSNCLESSDKSTRLCGMRVAKSFAEIMQLELQFDELEQEEKNEEDHRRLARSRLGASSSGSGGAEIEGQLQSNDPVDRLSSADSGEETSEEEKEDSDSDFVPYASNDPAHGENTVRYTPYLRLCLDYLCHEEGRQDAYEKQRIALCSIPRIMRKSPPDGKILCAPLVQELYRLNNAFNLENFEGLQETAVLSLVDGQPVQAADMMCQLLFSESVILGTKLRILDNLVRSAHVLAQLPYPRFSKENGNDPDNYCIAGVPLATESSVDDASIVTSDLKTRIKRPLRLQSLKEQNKARVIRNRFIPIAERCFSAVLRLFSNCLEKLLLPQESSSKELRKRQSDDLGGTFGILNGVRDDPGSYSINEHIPSGVLGRLRIVEEIPVSSVKETGPFLSVGNATKTVKPLDSMRCLLPAKCLWALAAFTKCVHNYTSEQERFMWEVTQAASVCKDLASPELRKAALASFLLVARIWAEDLREKRNCQVTGHRIPTATNEVTALSILKDISIASNSGGVVGEDGFGAAGGELSGNQGRSFANIATWCAETFKEEADADCRAMKLEILRAAVEAFE